MKSDLNGSFIFFEKFFDKTENDRQRSEKMNMAERYVYRESILTFDNIPK